MKELPAIVAQLFPIVKGWGDCIIASGRVISRFDMVQRVALGADLCNAARGFLFSLGCIQALECNRNTCPTGIATQDPRRTRGLVVAEKRVRVESFHAATARSFLDLVGVAGLTHPSELRPWHVQQRISELEVRSYGGIYRSVEPGAFLRSGGIPREYEWPMRLSSPDSFGPRPRSAAAS